MSETTPCRIPAYADVHRLFKHRELGGLCHQSLAKNGPQDTRELALYAMQAKGLDTGDGPLASAIAFRVVQTLRMQEKRGKITAQASAMGAGFGRFQLCRWKDRLPVTQSGDKMQARDLFGVALRLLGVWFITQAGENAIWLILRLSSLYPHGSVDEEYASRLAQHKLFIAFYLVLALVLLVYPKVLTRLLYGAAKTPTPP